MLLLGGRDGNHSMLCCGADGGFYVGRTYPAP